MDYIKVKDHPNLYRASESASIVNKDRSGFDEYMKKREFQKEEKQRIQQLEENVSIISEDLQEIKNLLRNLTK